MPADTKAILTQLDQVPYDAEPFTNEGIDTRFFIKSKAYTPQFSQLYFQRLAVLKPVVLEAARTKWKAHIGR